MGVADQVTVIVATFGDPKWEQLAYRRAVPSVTAQSDPPPAVMLEHDDTLAAARNHGAHAARTEWLCFLDADDELEPGYLTALLAAGGSLRAPSVRFDDAEPVSLAHRSMARWNPCVIGTLIRRDKFFEIGGFWDEPAWEDWSLFRRAWLTGARISHTPQAVYHVHVNPDGRNHVADPRTLHRSIVQSHDAWLKQRKGRR